MISDELFPLRTTLRGSEALRRLHGDVPIPPLKGVQGDVSGATIQICSSRQLNRIRGGPSPKSD